MTIPKNVSSIGEEAFWLCSSLEEINVHPQNAYFTDDGGVLYSKDLTVLVRYPGGMKNASFSIPETVKTVGHAAFGWAVGMTDTKDPLKDVTLPNGEDPLKEIIIPNGVVEIKDKAFKYCGGLTGLEMPDSVTYIGTEAFKYCESLKSIRLSPNITEIPESSFKYCASLENIVIPNGVTLIDDMAFKYCYGLKTVSIGNKVTSISADAFRYCENLTIYGDKGSFAELYARGEELPFIQR